MNPADDAVQRLGMHFRFDDELFVQHYDEVVTHLVAQCPVLSGDDGYYLLTRYEDVRQAALDPTMITGEGVLKPRPDDMPIHYPMEADPPFHTVLRQAINSFFSPRSARAYEPLVAEVANQLIDEFEPGGVDAVAKFSRPLPGLVMFRGLLDLPTELVEPLGKAIYQMYSGALGGARSFREGVDAALAHHAAKSDPQGLMGAITRLLIDGQAASHEVKHSLVTSMIVGGLDTTTSVLSQAIHYLGDHPAARDLLLREPSVMSAAVEEFLRLYAPAIALGRVATQPTTIAGHQFVPGDFVYLGWGTASRDPAMFADALSWDPGRPNKSHMAYGIGRHRCIGAPIATVELIVALTVLLERIPRFSIESGFKPRYSAGFNRTIANVPIVY